MVDIESKPKSSVSVIIPCYNCTSTLEQCLDSVANQTWLPAEVILINDCSTDSTEDLIQALMAKYPQGWIRAINLNVNQGVAGARNEGWNLATQKFAAFLDSDDVWHPQKIEIQYQWMLEHPECTLSFHLIAEKKKGSLLEHKMFQTDGVTALPVNKRRLFFSNSISTSSVIIKRDIPHRFPQSFRHSEDYSLWLDICFSGNLCFCLPLELGYRFKVPFGQGGLSGQLWNMQKGELRAYLGLWRKQKIGCLAASAGVTYSFLKFFRRLLIAYFRSYKA